MPNKYQPVIVVVAFNRTKSLKRILDSLVKAVYTGKTRLIISIDNNGTNQDVVDLANHYSWEFGEKEVIYRPEHLGLRKHILTCGDLTYQYGSIIMLEDDLVVSPYFYHYAVEALNFYKDSTEIAGISLYNLPYTEASKLPFLPLKDDSDVYFMQVPSSLGQAWTMEHWDKFKKWFDTNPDLNKIEGLPIIATRYWSASSWKKYFYGYLVDFNKFFVFPQVSLTTNFNDRGENMYAKTYFGQVSLQMRNISYKWKLPLDSINVYDAYSEILPEKLKVLCSKLEGYDFETDLFGQKESFSKEFVLTHKPCRNPIFSFERAMKPHELNIIFNIEGSELCLAKREDVLFTEETIKNLLYRTKPVDQFLNDFAYYYTNVFDTKKMMRIVWFNLKNKLRNFKKRE